MSDITVRGGDFQVENRSWLLGPHGTDPGSNPSLTLLVSLFTAGTHYPNGFVPSGIVLGKVTASGVYGPYDPAAVDGREVAAELLFGSLPVRTGATRLAGAGFHHGSVNPARLPIQSGTGALTDAARLNLHGISFSDKVTVIPEGA